MKAYEDPAVWGTFVVETNEGDGGSRQLLFGVTRSSSSVVLWGRGGERGGPEPQAPLSSADGWGEREETGWRK